MKTRFAPSPTGLLHVGNVRTALFNALLAWREGGVFLLRIEDTDRERSGEAFDRALREDLRWLGLDWQEGPDAAGREGPYHQSARTDIYAGLYERLIQDGWAYPCFCSPQDLETARKAQRAAGQPPRYTGKCARLDPDEARRRVAAGEPHTLRFRVPADRSIEFDDLVRGPQRFPGSEIGDFIIRRADGGAAFFFCNAVDDALMGVTHVLRGEDHITNTPRQLLVAQALGLDAPRYGHISMIVGDDGAPLSKRHGATDRQESRSGGREAAPKGGRPGMACISALADLRAAGYLPAAVLNYLARLGHTYAEDALLSLEGLVAGFAVERLGRAPARYDDRQLLHWQQRAVEAAAADALWDWMGEPVQRRVPEMDRGGFIEAVRPNVLFPEDAERWARVLYEDGLEFTPEAEAVIADTGPAFFQDATAALTEGAPDDFKAFADAIKARTGAKGKGLFLPLRAALTGQTGGPEMAAVFGLLGPERVRRRLETACD